MGCPARRLSHRESQLHPAAPVEGFGQVLERQVMNGSNYGTRREGRGSVLDVQNIDRMTPQLARKSQRDADQRRMRQGLLDPEVRPTLIKPLDSGPFGDV